jgi:hypothetical protein
MRTLILVVLFQAYRAVNEPLACCFGQALRSSSMNLLACCFVQALRSLCGLLYLLFCFKRIEPSMNLCLVVLVKR